MVFIGFLATNKKLLTVNEMIQLLIGMSCGTTEEDGRVTDVVAAGGGHSNTVFIYNLESGVWRSGKVFKFAVASSLHNKYFLTGENLPMQINGGTSVPYQGSFLILGGYCYSCTDKYHDTVIRYTENGEWETLPIRLATARQYHTAIPKPAC